LFGGGGLTRPRLLGAGPPLGRTVMLQRAAPQVPRGCLLHQIFFSAHYSFHDIFIIFSKLNNLISTIHHLLPIFKARGPMHYSLITIFFQMKHLSLTVHFHGISSIKKTV
jgi:hypothetical protein